MSEKSPHPKCPVCQGYHRLGAPHSWDKPSETKEQRRAIADAVMEKKASKVPKSPRSQKPETPRSSKGRTPGLEKLDAAKAAVSASDAGDAGSNPATGTSKRGRGRPRLADPKSPRAEYQRELMRKRYAAKKRQPDGDV